MYIERVPNRNSPPAVLLRESFREDGKVKKRTLANLSKWPNELVEGFRILLKGGIALPSLGDAFRILRSRPHGHVAAVLGCARRLGLEKLLDRRVSRNRALAAAMILARILDPRSKLATARSLKSETLTHTLAEELGIEDASENELYRAMDWLLKRQDRIQRHLAARHLKDGALVLCDITSVYFEGSTCPLAKLGYSRDGKRGKPQIVFALLCNRDGCPVAVEVFEGNTADPGTLGAQLKTLRDRFSLSRVAAIAGCSPRPVSAKRSGPQGWRGSPHCVLQRSASWWKVAPCRCHSSTNRIWPRLPRPISTPASALSCAATRCWPPSGHTNGRGCSLPPSMSWTRLWPRPGARSDRCGAKIRSPCGPIGRFAATKSANTSILSVPTTPSFGHATRNASPKKLLSMASTSSAPSAEKLPAAEAVRSYKSLSRIERAFRSYKTIDLKVRPVYHRLEGRVRAHVFLCMLAYYVEWHMRRALVPLLFDDDPTAAEASRSSPVMPARSSSAARAKAGRKRTPDGLPVHSFQTLLADLATLTRNRVLPMAEGAVAADVLTIPTPLQAEAFRLLDVCP